ncbi:MAG: delta(1)-pyrroline-2-carboxylate reductase family protein [Trueperaceae bacterium]
MKVEPPRSLGPGETAALLPYPALADTIAAMLLEYEGGKVQVPERLILELPDGGKLLVMPASDENVAITKLVTVHPRNSAKGLATIQGEVVVMRAGSGERMGVLDGATVTGRRTAALSLLAARKLAPVPTGPLLIFGAGAQATAHLEAFRIGLGVDTVFISSRTRHRAETLAGLGRELGMDARVVDDPNEVLGKAKLIVTATTSQTPVLAGSLAEDVMVCAVGAFRPGMAELSPELIGGSSVVVDTLAAARQEAGDLIAAVGAGAWQWERARELAQVLAPEMEAAQLHHLPGPVVFKSVGHALFDLASARLAFLA